ncbi:MAG TPA: pyridoxamine 5'-phosphate oxidase family protein [Candidatus Binatia bacterium]|nr:pyridoxamine 5'-phosphate oxidase family protein [Candidatus Binatia bacterium]
MISEKLVEFLHGPVFMAIGTRDEKLRPAHTVVVGAIVNQDRETISCFVLQSRAEQIMGNLENNARIALSAGSPSHESYQFKGRYVSARPTDAKDVAIQEIYRTKLVALMLQYGYPEQIVKPLVLGFRGQPAVAITFRVEEIFLQTPGPEAGKRIA